MLTFALQLLPRTATLTVVLVAAAALAQEQPTQPNLGNADKTELVIGDGYEIKVGPGPTTHNVGGDLLKTTDDWLVIGVRKVVARSTRVPWVGDLPYVGALFRTTSQREEAAVYWISRANATIESRIKATSKEHLAAYKIDELKLTDCERIIAAPEGKEQHFMPVSDISASDGLLHFKYSQNVAVNVVVNMRHIPLTEVFYATQPLPVEQPAAKTATTRRRIKR